LHRKIKGKCRVLQEYSIISAGITSGGEPLREKRRLAHFAQLRPGGGDSPHSAGAEPPAARRKAGRRARRKYRTNTTGNGGNRAPQKKAAGPAWE
jgi:hypothetical protein